MDWRGPPLIVAAAVLAAGLGLAASLAWRDAPPEHAPVAPFRLPDREGRPVQLPTPGRALLINYWASWCEPCRREMPLLNEFAARAGRDGPAVVGIALDGREQAEAFLATTPVAFPILLEAPGPGDSSVRLGNTRGVLPYSVLIDAQGRLQATHIGPFADRQQLDAWAAAAR